MYAFAGGRQAFVELVDPFDQAEAGAGEGDAAIRAPMNGRLVAVAVEEGERVEAGQRLAVVEAMKMEHALVAPHAGVVRDLERASATRSRWASASCGSRRSQKADADRPAEGPVRAKHRRLPVRRERRANKRQ